VTNMSAIGRGDDRACIAGGIGRSNDRARGGHEIEKLGWNDGRTELVGKGDEADVNVGNELAISGFRLER